MEESDVLGDKATGSKGSLAMERQKGFNHDKHKERTSTAILTVLTVSALPLS